MTDVRRAHELQVGRIARQLDVAPEEVLGLDDVPVEDLRLLHEQLTEALFGDAREGFAKIATLAGLAPAPLAARLAQRFVSPVMAARVCEALDPGPARDLVERLPVSYLADVAVLLDPVRSRPVVATMTPARVGAVTRELFGRGEHAVTAELVNAVSVEGLRASVAAATPHDVLAVAPLLEWGPALDTVAADLPPAQAAEILEALDTVELADLVLALDPARCGPLLSAATPETRARLVEEVRTRDEPAAARLERLAGPSAGRG